MRFKDRAVFFTVFRFGIPDKLIKLLSRDIERLLEPRSFLCYFVFGFERTFVDTKIIGVKYVDRPDRKSVGNTQPFDG